MLREILAVLAGLAASFLVIMLMDGISGRLYPMGAVDMHDKVVMKATWQLVPVLVKLLICFSPIIGACIGGGVAARIGTERRLRSALVVGAITLLGGIMNLASLWHPAWMWGQLLLYMPAAWLGWRVVAPRADLQ
jgi:uncharacterized membrane protein